jgi:hypothetical protein
MLIANWTTFSSAVWQLTWSSSLWVWITNRLEPVRRLSRVPMIFQLPGTITRVSSSTISLTRRLETAASVPIKKVEMNYIETSTSGVQNTISLRDALSLASPLRKLCTPADLSVMLEVSPQLEQ